MKGLGYQKVSEMTVTCYYCGAICENTGTRDHLNPLSMGEFRGKRQKRHGSLARKSLKHNMVYACVPCNKAKDYLTFEDFTKTKYYWVNCASGKWKGYVIKKA